MRDYLIRLLPRVKRVDRLSYPLKRTGHASPALCPERVLLKQVPLGQSPSLHRLRSPFGSLFGNFSGSMELSDFLCPFIIGLRPQTSQRGPRSLSLSLKERGRWRFRGHPLKGTCQEKKVVRKQEEAFF